MEELTKAQQLIEMAAFIKRQSNEFTKNFKTMRSIIKFYLRLPADYDRKKSITEYIRKNLKSESYTARLNAEKLALIVNTLFGFRYFKGAPAKYFVRLTLSSGKRNGADYYEVRSHVLDRCCAFDDFKPYDQPVSSIRVNAIGDVKAAADRLLKSETEKASGDFEVEYGSHLKEAMKKSKPTCCQLTEKIDIAI